jgi:hypothetical protein
MMNNRQMRKQKHKKIKRMIGLRNLSFSLGSGNEYRIRYPDEDFFKIEPGLMYVGDAELDMPPSYNNHIASRGRDKRYGIVYADDSQFVIPANIPMTSDKLGRGRTSFDVQCVCVDGELSAILLK